MTINFLKYTITIYPLHNDSLVKKNERKKTFWKPKTKKKIQSYFQAPQTIS